ncbi:Triosephosphate isomerase [Pisolithus croceorrhizus]|nr:Triosephosphate isomerase [Pisolithus croceorrhizus]KAI6141140.1 Triosephosphate isomerase [Pisolithus thermaeus]
MSRQFFVSGNFKMNPISRAQKKIIINELNAADLDSNTEVVTVTIPLPLKDIVRNDIKVSAQNCYYKTSGAYTGEISPAQLADAGVPYVILGNAHLPNHAAPFNTTSYMGHSERLTLFHETSELVAQKTKVALDGSLPVILCVGETLQEREAGQTTRAVEKELRALVTVLNESDGIVIAYEPVWAIGTGKVAITAQAQGVHAYIRQYLSTAISTTVSDNTRIIYGGSVTASNCKEFSSQIDVDGFLVGGASLKPEFVDIINVRRN